jgi:hypothetical protein
MGDEKNIYEFNNNYYNQLKEGFEWKR